MIKNAHTLWLSNSISLSLCYKYTPHVRNNTWTRLFITALLIPKTWKLSSVDWLGMDLVIYSTCVQWKTIQPLKRIWRSDRQSWQRWQWHVVVEGWSFQKMVLSRLFILNKMYQDPFLIPYKKIDSSCMKDKTVKTLRRKHKSTSSWP